MCDLQQLAIVRKTATFSRTVPVWRRSDETYRKSSLKSMNIHKHKMFCCLVLKGSVEWTEQMWSGSDPFWWKRECNKMQMQGLEMSLGRMHTFNPKWRSPCWSYSITHSFSSFRHVGEPVSIRPPKQLSWGPYAGDPEKNHLFHQKTWHFVSFRACLGPRKRFLFWKKKNTKKEKKKNPPPFGARALFKIFNFSSLLLNMSNNNVWL